MTITYDITKAERHHKPDAFSPAIALDVGAIYEQTNKLGLTVIELHASHLARHEEVMQRACEDIADAANNIRVLAAFLERKIAMHRRRNPNVR